MPHYRTLPDYVFKLLTDHEGVKNEVYQLDKDPPTFGIGNTASSFRDGVTDFTLTNPKTGESARINNPVEFKNFAKGRYNKWVGSDEDIEKLFKTSIEPYIETAKNAYGKGWDDLPFETQAAIVDEYWNGPTVGKIMIDTFKSKKKPTRDKLLKKLKNSKIDPEKVKKYSKSWINRILGNYDYGTSFDMDDVDVLPIYREIRPTLYSDGEFANPFD